MVARKDARGRYIQSLLRESPVSRNQIAAISGLSSPYILGLEQGNIANVGRDKLLSLAVALDMKLGQIDDMLTIFGRSGLSGEDIPIFLEASRRCRISAALHPAHDSYTLDLLLLSVERIRGDHVIVSPRPPSCLRAEGHRYYSEKALVDAHPIYGDLVVAILRERKGRLVKNLSDHSLEHYMCRKCLEDYIQRCDDGVERAWRVEHVKNTVSLLKEFENFRLFLTRECPSFVFVLKSPPRSSRSREKLVITVLPPHRFQVRTSGLLAGFATDSRAVILNFKEEVKYLKEAVVEEFLDRGRLVDYLEDLIS